MKSKFGYLLPVIFIIALGISLFITYYTFNTLQALTLNDQVFDRLHTITTELDGLKIRLYDAEINIRNYLITGDTKYSEFVFENALPRARQHITRLKVFFKNEPLEIKNLTLVEKHLEQRVKQMNEARTLLISEGFDAIKDVYITGENIKKTNDIRLITNEMLQRQSNLMETRRQTTGKQFKNLSNVLLASDISNILLITLFYFFINKELTTRNKEERLKDEFINMASHELKTPVTSLKIFTHILDKKLEEGKVGEAKRYIGKLEGQMFKLTLLISDLLDLSRIQTGKMRFEKEGFNLDALIDETVEEIQGTTKKHEIVIKGSINRMVYADRYRIYQVLVNLLGNAVKYSPEGGKVIISSTIENKRVLISIKDSGIGIEEKFQKKIFERLYQVTDKAEKTYPGLGVGLYISAKIIKEHKGQIWVKSDKGKGSTFYFSLPVGD